jgi:ABC-type multidrug transport system ATPase subunit
MDDPLSAVDSQAGRHIMDNAICGLLKDKCRILATHQLHVLHRCNRIVYVSEGRIIADGTFDHLMANNIPFQRMMAAVAHEDGQKEREADEEQAEERKNKQEKMKNPPAALMQVEERAVKSVSWSVYAAYVRASGTILNLPLIFILLIAAQGSNVSTSLWLSWWTSNKFVWLPFRNLRKQLLFISHISY